MICYTLLCKTIKVMPVFYFDYRSKFLKINKRSQDEELKEKHSKSMVDNDSIEQVELKEKGRK